MTDDAALGRRPPHPAGVRRRGLSASTTACTWPTRAARRCVVAPYREGGQAQYIERPIRPVADQAAPRTSRNLLKSTDLTVDQIALEIGFATAASLRQHLNAELGVSPVAYRRKFRAADSSA